MAFVLPEGYRAVQVGLASDFVGLNSFSFLEESQAEGSRMLCVLTFANQPSLDVVSVINERCKRQGVTPWPEYQDIAFLDPAEPVLYISWQKGQAWWVWIVGLLASLILPPLITAVLYLILPESIKELINAVMYLGIISVVMLVMSKMVKSVTEAK